MSSAAMVTRDTFPMFMRPEKLKALSGKYFDKLETIEEMRSKYFNVESTTDPYYIEHGLVGLTKLWRKPEATGVRFDKPTIGRTFKMAFPSYALGVAVTREAQDDDQTNTLVPRIIKMMKRAAVETMEEQAASMFNDGFTRQGWESDDVSVWNNQHPIIKPGIDGITTWSNRSPTNAALSITSLDAATVAMGTIKDDSGNWVTGLGIKNLDVHPLLERYATQLTRTAKVLGSNNNDTNLYYGDFAVRKNPRFKSTTAWFADSGMHSWLWMNRIKLELATDVNTMRGITYLRVYARWGYGVVDPRGKYASGAAV